MCCENGIPGDTISSPDAAGEMIVENDYAPTTIKNSSEIQRAKNIVNYFLGQHLPIEIGIGVAGVWWAESRIKTSVYNKAEHDNGYAFKNIHAPNAKTFTYNKKTYYMDQANMMSFGYGKGLAQWSWSRNFKFRDWYNSSSSAVKTEGLVQMDDNASNITATSETTQTAFAWKEMQERTGEFMEVINGITGSTSKDEFNANIVKVVDAVLRGFENGGNKKMASIAQIDKYTWSGGYKGSMKKRVSGALGIAEAIKNDYSQLEFLR